MHFNIIAHIYMYVKCKHALICLMIPPAASGDDPPQGRIATPTSVHGPRIGGMGIGRSSGPRQAALYTPRSVKSWFLIRGSRGREGEEAFQHTAGSGREQYNASGGPPGPVCFCGSHPGAARSGVRYRTGHLNWSKVKFRLDQPLPKSLAPATDCDYHR